MAKVVRFIAKNKTEFDQMQTKDTNAIYFVFDNTVSENAVNQIYKGDILYSGSVFPTYLPGEHITFDTVGNTITINADCVGEWLEEGSTYTYSGITYTVGKKVERFNCYEDDAVLGVTANEAAGNFSHVEGASNRAYGSYSHAEGYGCKAVDLSAHAEGYQTTALGMYTHAEGMSNTAVGNYSHAEGNGNNSVGVYAHAEGQNNTAQGEYSHIEGYGNKISAVASGAHVEGYGNTATAINSHAEGFGCYANGQSAHVEGDNNSANGNSSHAEGSYSSANGVASHAEGTHSTASAQNAHAGGDYSTANATNTFAHGEHATASSPQAVAFGNYTTADGDNSCAIGNGTIANDHNQLAIGYFNVSTSKTSGGRSVYPFIIGNGTADNARADAFKVDNTGKIYVGSDTTGVDVRDLTCSIVTNTTTTLPNKLVIENNHEYRYLSLTSASSITISIETIDTTKSFYSTVVLHNVSTTDVLSTFVQVSNDSLIDNIIFLNEDSVDLSSNDTLEMMFFSNGMPNSVMCIAYAYTAPLSI